MKSSKLNRFLILVLISFVYISLTFRTETQNCSMSLPNFTYKKEKKIPDMRKIYYRNTKPVNNLFKIFRYMLVNNEFLINLSLIIIIEFFTKNINNELLKMLLKKFLRQD